MAELRWWAQHTPVGRITVTVGDAGIVRLDLPPGAEPPEDAVDDVDRAVAAELDAFLAGELRRFATPVDLSGVGGEYRRTVLETLLREVSWGETVSYGELAAMAGRPAAVRAVGSAMSHNPVAIVVPCHRVLHADGSLGGYGGGLTLKQALLDLEQGLPIARAARTA